VERDDSHIYMHEGNVYLSCTQHIQIAGLVDFSMINPVILAHAALRGQYVHDAVRLYLNDDLDIGTLDESYAGYVQGFVKFCKDHNLEVWDSESIIWSDRLRTAGTFDFVGKISSDHAYAYMFEIKTSSAMPLTIGLQLAGYVKLWNKCRDNNIFGGYGLLLKKNGTYSLTKYDLLKYGDWFESIVRCNWNAIDSGMIPIGTKENSKLHDLCETLTNGG